MQRKTVVISGIVFLATIFLFFWGMNFLKGKNILMHERLFYAVYDDVNGLNVGSPVTFRGYKVGNVKNIKLMHQSGSRLLVVFNIEKNFNIPVDSKAEIYNADMLGTRALRIVVSDSQEYMKPGDTLESIVETGVFDKLSTEFSPLKSKTEDFIVSLDTVMQVLNELIILNQMAINSSVGDLKLTMQHLEKITAELEKMSTEPDGKIYKIIADIETLTSTLEQNQMQIDSTIKNFKTISDSLAAANFVETVDLTNQILADLSVLTEQMKNGEGSAGKLFAEDSLYNNLDSLIKSLTILTQDIKDNPHKYFRISLIDNSKNN